MTNEQTQHRTRARSTTLTHARAAVDGHKLSGSLPTDALSAVHVERNSDEISDLSLLSLYARSRVPPRARALSPSLFRVGPAARERESTIERAERWRGARDRGGD